MRPVVRVEVRLQNLCRFCIMPADDNSNYFSRNFNIQGNSSRILSWTSNRPEEIMKHVLIPTKLDPIAKNILEENGFEVVQDQETPLLELAAAHPETGVLIVRSDKVTAEVVDAFPNLKLVARAGSGYNTIDTKYARKKNIDVMNTPGANANAVAEEVFALALAHYRHVVPADNSTRSGKWEKKAFMGRELCGKTLGIVGLGNIGQLVLKRSSGFEMTVLGYDPVISAGKAEELGVRLVDLQTLFRESDIITLHVPETDETRGMVNRDLLPLMKPDSTLINCARAGIINEDDLRDAKRNNGIGFCNDVYAEDAPGEKSVADIADVMLPHLGASTREANENAARRAAEQTIAYREMGITRYIVNKGVPDGLDASYQQLAFELAYVARHYVGADRPIRRIECSFYGDLQQFTQWFISPIVAGICPDFDSVQDPEEAQDYLSEKGISLEIRDTDESKGYHDSMTIDLVEGDERLRHVSVRGTVTEGNPVVSRINEFDKLYLQPGGHSLLVVYRDRPGMLARITVACADEDINIDDIRSPRDSDGLKAMAVLKTNKPVSASVVERIRRETESDVAFSMTLV